MTESRSNRVFETRRGLKIGNRGSSGCKKIPEEVNLSPFQVGRKRRFLRIPGAALRFAEVATAGVSLSDMHF